MTLTTRGIRIPLLGFLVIAGFGAITAGGCGDKATSEAPQPSATRSGAAQEDRVPARIREEFKNAPH